MSITKATQEVIDGSNLTVGVASVANGLKSATTDVSVSAAAAPEVGQVLTATSPTTATWQSGGGGTSLPVTDTTTLVSDPADATKLVRLDAGAVPTGTTSAIQAAPTSSRIRDTIWIEMGGDQQALSMTDTYTTYWPGNFTCESIFGSVVTQGAYPVEIRAEKNNFLVADVIVDTAEFYGGGVHGATPADPTYAEWTTGSWIRISVPADGTGSAGYPAQGLKVAIIGYWHAE